MAAHFRIASDNARMGLPEVSLGVIPGYGGTQRLPQLVGKGRAMEMIMTAGMIDADTALDYGLINHIVTQEELLPLAEKLAGGRHRECVAPDRDLEKRFAPTLGASVFLKNAACRGKCFLRSECSVWSSCQSVSVVVRM